MRWLLESGSCNKIRYTEHILNDIFIYRLNIKKHCLVKAKRLMKTLSGDEKIVWVQIRGTETVVDICFQASCSGSKYFKMSLAKDRMLMKVLLQL
jgi:hypothetical protein